jgi:hypothetical protein
MFMRSGDGSTVESRVDKLPEGTTMQSRFITDLQKQTRTSVNDYTKTTTTYPDGGTRLRELYRLVKNGCTEDFAAEESQLLGYRIVKALHRTSQNGTHAPSRKSELWVAPDLGCAELKKVSKSINPDGSELTLVTEAIAIAPGEPDASWFQIASDYTERQPSEAMRVLRGRSPGLPSSTPKESVATLDSAYRNSWANAEKIQSK